MHLANTLAPYRNWVFYNGYRRRDGLRVAPAIAANTVLPHRDHINLQAFGQPDPPRSVWDDYNTYRGPQPKGKAKAKASVFTQNTEPQTPEEDNSNLGVDSSVQRHLVSHPRQRLGQRLSQSSRKHRRTHLRGRRHFVLLNIR